jgi:hypothetical protein
MIRIVGRPTRSCTCGRRDLSGGARANDTLVSDIFMFLRVDPTGKIQMTGDVGSEMENWRELITEYHFLSRPERTGN